MAQKEPAMRRPGLDPGRLWLVPWLFSRLMATADCGNGVIY
jgi:hypothetical protein